MIFINEALFTVCFLRVLRVLVTVFALGLLKQLSLCSVLRPRKGGETWTQSPGLGLLRGLDQGTDNLHSEQRGISLCFAICDVCGLWFIDNNSLCSGQQLVGPLAKYWLISGQEQVVQVMARGEETGMTQQMTAATRALCGAVTG